MGFGTTRNNMASRLQILYFILLVIFYMLLQLYFRYESVKNWSSSQYLGEHVAGSAVRSVCFVSKMHIFMPNSFATPNEVYGQNGASEDENPSILISVGAKRVVTAWKQIVQMNNQKLDLPCDDVNLKSENNLNGSSTTTLSSFSFQWLSTDMPHKYTNFVNRNKEFAADDHNTTTSDATSSDHLENDWRYLDVTAFLVKEPGSRSVH